MGAARDFIEELREEVSRVDDDAIWDFDDIAEYLKVSRETVKKKASTVKSFPRPLHYMRGRYRAGDIREWALRT